MKYSDFKDKTIKVLISKFNGNKYKYLTSIRSMHGSDTFNHHTGIKLLFGEILKNCHVAEEIFLAHKEHFDLGPDQTNIEQAVMRLPGGDFGFPEKAANKFINALRAKGISAFLDFPSRCITFTDLDALYKNQVQTLKSTIQNSSSSEEDVANAGPSQPKVSKPLETKSEEIVIPAKQANTLPEMTFTNIDSDQSDDGEIYIPTNSASQNMKQPDAKPLSVEIQTPADEKKLPHSSPGTQPSYNQVSVTPVVTNTSDEKLIEEFKSAAKKILPIETQFIAPQIENAYEFINVLNARLEGDKAKITPKYHKAITNYLAGSGDLAKILKSIDRYAETKSKGMKKKLEKIEKNINKLETKLNGLKPKSKKIDSINEDLIKLKNEQDLLTSTKNLLTFITETIKTLPKPEEQSKEVTRGMHPSKIKISKTRDSKKHDSDSEQSISQSSSEEESSESVQSTTEESGNEAKNSSTPKGSGGIDSQGKIKTETSSKEETANSADESESLDPNAASWLKNRENTSTSSFVELQKFHNSSNKDNNRKHVQSEESDRTISNTSFQPGS